MSGLSFTVAPDIFRKFPGYRRGVVVARGCNNSLSNTVLTDELRRGGDLIRQTIPGNPSEVPRIAAWRDAYRQFGAKPSEHRSSIEALVRRSLKPENLASINTLVDIGTLASLRFLMPVGVHPMSVDLSEVALRFSIEGDAFLPADGGQAETPSPGEVVLASGNQILTRRWTWRQARDTQTGIDETDVFFNVDALPPSSLEEALAAMTAICSLVQTHCAANVFSFVLDEVHPTNRIDD